MTGIFTFSSSTNRWRVASSHFSPLHSLLLGPERERQKQEGEVGRHLQLFPKDRSLVPCLDCWSCCAFTRRWAATFQHSERRGWIFRAWKGFTSFFPHDNGITLLAPGQVYLIEYNQQMKDACIKSDKMTSTHKVVDLEDRYGKERTLTLNHESPGSSWQLHKALCLSPRHRHLGKLQVALLKDHLDNDNYSHNYFPPALKYSSPNWATLLKKCEGLRGE